MSPFLVPNGILSNDLLTNIIFSLAFEFRMLVRSLLYSELVTKSQILQDQIASADKQPTK